MSSSLSKREVNRQRWSERIEDWSGERDPAFCHRSKGLVIFRKPERGACQCYPL